LALAQATVYLATAPKSNAVYTAYSEAVKDVERFGSLPVPLYLRNAPTALMQALGYGRDYKYPHQYKDGIVDQNYFPEELKQGRTYYRPTDRGFEKVIKERIKHWEKIRQELQKKNSY